MESRKPPEVKQSKWNLDKILSGKEINVFSIGAIYHLLFLLCDMTILITDILLLLWQMFYL